MDSGGCNFTAGLTMQRHQTRFTGVSPERVVENHFASGAKRTAIDEKANRNSKFDSFAGTVCAIAINSFLRLLRRRGDGQQAN